MQGTRDISAFLAVPDAIHYQEANGWTEARARCHELLKQTVREISQLSNEPPISPLSSAWFCQMASAPLPASINAAEFHQQLYDTFRIEIPVLDWHGKKLIRCSFQAYN